MAKFCIKKLNVEFRKISEDQYSIIDLSEYDYNDIEDVYSGINQFNIKTPTNEDFTVLVPAGRSQIFSIKSLRLLPLHDGQYCITTESCGAQIKKLVGYYPVMREKIDGLVVTTKDKKYIHLLFEEFKMMQILDEHGDKKSAERIYQDIRDMLEKCGPGQKCF